MKRGANRSLLPRSPGFWFFQIAGWTVFYFQQYIQYYNELKGFQDTFRWTLSMSFLFLITLMLRIIYRKIFIRRSGFILIAVSGLLLSFFSAAIWVLFNTLLLEHIVEYLTGWDITISKPADLSEFLSRTFFLAFPVVIWSLLYFGIKFWLELIKEKERSQEAALLAQKSQLKMLRYQLNPHFLFNSLNSIQALIYEDPSNADRMISQLSDFLRYTIRDKDKLFIPLREEVIIVEKYLSLEKVRFPDRLNFEINVTSEASDVEVLAFILQPFVENAVKYGMRASPDSLNIMVNGFRRGRLLILEVINNGIWFESDNEGTGIRNVFERLQNAYPDRYKLNIEKNEGMVHITIEIQTEE